MQRNDSIAEEYRKKGKRKEFDMNTVKVSIEETRKERKENKENKEKMRSVENGKVRKSIRKED